MNAPSANKFHFISRRAIVMLALTLLAFVSAPILRAETPPDQIKAAGAITLTTNLLDKMDEFIKAMNSNNAAKAELAAVSKDPSMTPENWGSIVTAKCPKTVEVFEETEITPDEFGKAIFAIMAVSMAEDLGKSTDKAVAANAAFVEANKERAGAIFGAFMMMGEPPPAS